MTRLVLVRHAEAAAGWTEDADPGLSDEGRRQASTLSDALGPHGPMPVVVSPLRRTRETAAALEARWGVIARVEPAVAEVPSPAGDLADRGPWLMRLLRTQQQDWPDELRRWGTGVLDALLAIDEPSVVVTHFVAIRVALGVDIYQPDYCSQTVVEADGDRLVVVELGRQRSTVVQ